MSLEKAFRFLYGFKTKPNTSGWLIHSALLQRWNYICLHCQGEFLDAQQQIFILPILQWLNQLCWDGYSSFCILFLTNSSNAYVRIGAWWNATRLFWNNPKHKNQIMLALESFQWRWMFGYHQCSMLGKLNLRPSCLKIKSADKRSNLSSVINIFQFLTQVRSQRGLSSDAHIQGRVCPKPHVTNNEKLQLVGQPEISSKPDSKLYKQQRRVLRACGDSCSKLLWRRWTGRFMPPMHRWKSEGGYWIFPGLFWRISEWWRVLSKRWSSEHLCVGKRRNQQFTRGYRSREPEKNGLLTCNLFAWHMAFWTS